MNFKEQPCLQVFWPPVCTSQPITSSQVLRSGLHPPLLCFQTSQIMIHRKRCLHLLHSHPPTLKLSEHFKGKRALLRPCCKRGKFNAKGKNWWKTTGPWQVGGQPDLTASNNQCVFTFNAYLRKIFFLLLHMSLCLQECTTYL